MPLDITNPAIIIFLKETYEKENRLRVNWNNNNSARILEAATLQRAPTNYFESDVVAHNMKEGLAAITRDHVTGGRNRMKVPIRDGNIHGIKCLRHGHSLVDVGLGDPKDDPRLVRSDTDVATDPIMRPVDPKLTQIIYKDKPEFGRVQYLEHRNKTWPEKKYYIAECSNWDYGWRMTDSKLRQVPQFGRCWRLMRTLKTRVGPTPDPEHYKSSEAPGPTKCP